MYESKFGFQRTPFQRDIPLEMLFHARTHQELARRLIYVAEQRRVLLLTGESGAGKSTALRVLKGQLDATRYTMIYLMDLEFTVTSFYRAILHALDLAPPYLLAETKALTRRSLLESYRNQKRTPVLMIDEAQTLAPRLLEELRGLLNYECDAFSPFALILAGTTELARKLKLRTFESLTQRIDMTYHLEGFTEAETKAYVEHHLRMAGSQAEVFTVEALARLHHASGGMARRINRLATLCLMAAASQDKKLVDASLVELVITHEVDLP